MLCAVAADNRMAVILVVLNSYGLSGSRAQFSIDPISLKNQVNGRKREGAWPLGRENWPLLDAAPGHFACNKPHIGDHALDADQGSHPKFRLNVSNPGAAS